MEILWCDNSNGSYQAVLSVVLYIMLKKVVLIFELVDETVKYNNSNESC